MLWSLSRLPRPLCTPAQVLRAGDAQALNFTAASFEGSTHYALEGKWLAPQMRELFPWLRMSEWQGAVFRSAKWVGVVRREG